MTTLLSEQDLELLEADDELAEDEERYFYEADDELAEDEERYFYEADDAEDEERYFREADDELAERRYFGRRRSPNGYRRRPGYGPYLRRRRPARGTGLSQGIAQRIRGVRSARVHTPQGTAQIQLPEAVVSKAELQTALSTLSARVGKEIRQNSGAIADLKKAISSEDTSTRKSFSGLESKLSGFEKSVNTKLKQGQDQSMMYMLLPMMMQTKPQLESVTLTPPGEGARPTQYSVTESKFKAADQMTTMMPLVLMMGMGGFGGNGGGQNQMMLMLMMVMMMQQQSSSQK